ncbi:hypothetical protein Lesp02_79340 [Lentzea sp. NBRC 105346]|uniref:hypothetical protein n=1 Tax=Lentzea sp. NBRC 105346 TaxID=3032205 RepID=UPI0024A59E60|nr:hypothetical protein [Lentzea sp. NBRC 105346]GLZ35747.1 hypothetical protein Lesp02_79340 [Lentzea sp. NBRC 105346]
MARISPVIAIAATVGLVAAAPASADVPQVMHSFGYKHLLLGMSPRQVWMTGLITMSMIVDEECAYFTLKESEGPSAPNTFIGLSRTTGEVTVIDATTPTRTPRDIGKGSTLDELQAAYPDAQQDVAHPTRWIADAPENPAAQYVFTVSTFTGEVGAYWLESDDNTCPN